MCVWFLSEFDSSLHTLTAAGRGARSKKMEDELEKFIRERKARVAEDQAFLGQDHPYMKIKVSPHRAYESTVQENIPPNTIVQRNGGSSSVGLPLALEYERKKQRLQQDHIRYTDQEPPLPPLQHVPDGQHCIRPPRWQIPSRRDATSLTELGREVHRAVRLSEGTTAWPEEDKDHFSPSSGLRSQVAHESEAKEYVEDLELLEGKRDRFTSVDADCDKRQSSKIYGRENINSVVAREGRRSRALKKSDGFVFATGLIIGTTDTEETLRKRKEHYRLELEEQIALQRQNKREKTKNSVREGRRSNTPTKNDDAVFVTGLIIGTTDTEETLQKKKECYRRELQEQIAVQQLNKKREKDLELKVAATGVNDPDKQPDRIREFGLSKMKESQVSQPAETEESKTSRTLSSLEKTARNGEPPFVKQCHVATQSPLLQYSSTLGLAEDGLPPQSKCVAPSNLRTSDPHRILLLPSLPAPVMSEAHRVPHGETPHLLAQNMYCYGHCCCLGTGVPLCYTCNRPLGGAVHGHLVNRSPHSPPSGSTYPERQTQPSSEVAAAGSGVETLPSESSRSVKEGILSYADALKQQIKEQEKRRRLEKEEQEHFEAQLEDYQPWGRSGGGAPVRDGSGNLIADLTRMHKQNAEAYKNPELWQMRATVAVASSTAEHPDHSKRLSDSNLVQIPRFAIGSELSSQSPQQKLQQQEEYLASLRQQIEDTKRKKAEEREQARLEDERLETVWAEQTARITKEYEEELEKKRREKMKREAKTEEVIHMTQHWKKEAEKKKRESEEKNEALRKQYERPLEQMQRLPSPPIPTVQKKCSPRPNTQENRRLTPQSESHTCLQRAEGCSLSPPVPICQNKISDYSEDSKDVQSTNFAIGSGFPSQSPQQKLQQQEEYLTSLRQQHEAKTVELIQQDERRKKKKETEGKNATLKKRYDGPREEVHREFSPPLHSLQKKIVLPPCSPRPTTLDSQLSSAPLSERSPSPPVPVCQNQLRAAGDQYDLIRELSMLRRQLSSEQKRLQVRQQQGSWDDLDLPFSDRHQEQPSLDVFDVARLRHQALRVRRPNSKSTKPRNLMQIHDSLQLKCTDPLDDVLEVPYTRGFQKTRQLSASKRRQLVQQSWSSQNENTCSKSNSQQHDNFCQEGSRLQREVEPSAEGRRQDRTSYQMDLSHHSNTAGLLDLSDEDSTPPLNRQNSVESIVRDPWVRPGTSDTLDWFVMNSISPKKQTRPGSSSR
ncbi:centrosome and spindle pole-associated protein 1-like [Thalassophryne amazonica]|uniref:centrosome and spindle pole-associated protein 1-like n=1 Tax=Thalassophryne amazonica TaxID=390379 RepID=UPI001470D648|nr:centrosome and spindle pole-associated protein 1-like [Thalassophryne amazonica]